MKPVDANVRASPSTPRLTISRCRRHFTSSGFTGQIVNGAWKDAGNAIDITYRYDIKGALKNGGTQ